MSDAPRGFKKPAGETSRHELIAPLVGDWDRGEPTPQARGLNTSCFYVPVLNTCPCREWRVSSAASGVQAIEDTMHDYHSTIGNSSIGIGNSPHEMTSGQREVEV